MRSAKRAARVREVQERLLQVRVSELEEAARRREAVHQARDAWSGRLMEAAAPRRASISSAEWTLWQHWAAFVADRVAELGNQLDAAERKVEQCREATLNQWQRAKTWGMLEERAAEEERHCRERREEKDREEAFLLRLAGESGEG
ncbi:MAG: flagellar FliJ family protein [Kyrpidia tusciae]|nr:flagellar FliJ family protein [Kyrpidia tusciae]MBE3553036.1 flagellar FliJ family protein [Kyrpidia tusciae]